MCFVNLKGSHLPIAKRNRVLKRRSTFMLRLRAKPGPFFSENPPGLLFLFCSRDCSPFSFSRSLARLYSLPPFRIFPDLYRIPVSLEPGTNSAPAKIACAFLAWKCVISSESVLRDVTATWNYMKRCMNFMPTLRKMVCFASMPTLCLAFRLHKWLFLREISLA